MGRARSARSNINTESQNQSGEGGGELGPVCLVGSSDVFLGSGPPALVFSIISRTRHRRKCEFDRCVVDRQEVTCK